MVKEKIKKSSFLIQEEKRKKNETIYKEYCFKHPIFNLVQNVSKEGVAFGAFFFFGFIELIITETYGLFTLIATTLTYFLSRLVYNEGIKEIEKIEHK